MAVKNDERQFEADIEELMTTELGWERKRGASWFKSAELGVDLDVRLRFVQLTQPR